MIRHTSPKGLLIALTVIASLMAGCAKVTAPSSPSKPGSTPAPTTKVVSVFPSQATVDLEKPSLLLRPNVNSRSIEAQGDAYTVQWSLNGVPISSELTLTASPFIKAISNKEGTYVVKLSVWDKATKAKIGDSSATITANKQKPIIISNHYVSTTAGKGMRYWTTYTGGKEWWEGDVDLRIQGKSGSLSFTVVAAAAHIPSGMRGIGQKTVFGFSDWKDDGTTAVFTSRNSRGQVYTFRLTRSTGNRLTGTMLAPETNIQGGVIPEVKGSLDLVRAP